MSNKTTRFKKVLFAGDIHFPDHDQSALDILLAFKKDFKPDYTCLMGDIVDADALSVHPGKKRSLKHQIDLALDFFDKVKPTHFLEGNHECRCNRDGVITPGLEEMVDLRSLLQIDKRKIKWAPYSNDASKGSFSFGKLRALHGFYIGEYAAAQHAKAFGCCVYGHTHRCQSFQSKQSTEKNTAFGLGCLCKLDLEYQRTGTPRGWTQGFGFAYVYPSGYFNFYNVRLIGDDFIINGRHYGRKTRSVRNNKQNEVEF